MDHNMIQFTENDSFAQYVGIELVEIREGYAVVQMKITDQHLNGVNIVHGGAIFTLADYAFAAASNAAGVITVGIQANISYFRSPRGKILFAEAKEISSTKKLCTYEVNVLDENKELIAKVNATGYKK